MTNSGGTPTSDLNSHEMRVYTNGKCNYQYGVNTLLSFTKRKVINGLMICARSNSYFQLLVTPRGPCSVSVTRSTFFLYRIRTLPSKHSLMMSYSSYSTDPRAWATFVIFHKFG
jgi:hypothetical protein